MKMSFGSRCGGSCLVVLIILALVGALVIVISRLNAVERERADEKQAAEAEPVEKTPLQLKQERIDEMLSAKAPDLGPDPSKALVDGNISTMKTIRDQIVRRQAAVRSSLKTAEESFKRLRGERGQLECKLAKLKDEFDRFPDDEAVGDDLAQCDEDLENKNHEVLQAQADVKRLKDLDYIMGRESARLASAIRRCESEGRTVATTLESEALKKDLATAYGSAIEIGTLARNLENKTMDSTVEATGEKVGKRERLQKYRKVKQPDGVEK